LCSFPLSAESLKDTTDLDGPAFLAPDMILDLGFGIAIFNYCRLDRVDDLCRTEMVLDLVDGGSEIGYVLGEPPGGAICRSSRKRANRNKQREPFS
jgi:hypothetical protein